MDLWKRGASRNREERWEDNGESGDAVVFGHRHGFKLHKWKQGTLF